MIVKWQKEEKYQKEEYPPDLEGEKKNPTSTSRVTFRPFKPPKTSETSFIDDDGKKSDSSREENVNKAWEIIKEIFPEFDPKNSPFTAEIDGFDRVMVKLKRLGGKARPLFDPDGKLNDKLPPTIKEYIDRTEEVKKAGLNKKTRRRERKVGRNGGGKK